MTSNTATHRREKQATYEEQKIVFPRPPAGWELVGWLEMGRAQLGCMYLDDIEEWRDVSVDNYGFFAIVCRKKYRFPASAKSGTVFFPNGGLWFVAAEFDCLRKVDDDNWVFERGENHEEIFGSTSASIFADFEVPPERRPYVVP